ncbi:MAG: GAF domain-containing protein [Deltaproteobacteria bacterium]|nr:GAF domain-containing protein [Deltaproteobacteria bacterium]
MPNNGSQAENHGKLRVSRKKAASYKIGGKPSASLYVIIIAAVLVLIGLYLASLYSYLLFHSLAEIFSIVVASCIFVVAWNSQRFSDNNYLLFIGIAFLFVACLDLVHTLGYTGMGIFHGYDTNLPAQLWIAGRYMESISLLIAPLFLRRRLNPNLVLMVYALATLLVLGSVFYWHIFPTCFVEGVGLTPFKKISEYIISIILLVTIAVLFQNRKELDKRVFRLLVASIALTIASEMTFTFYIHAYGFSNLVGHYFKIISFYLIYKAIIETSLVKPYDLMFRNLKQSEEALSVAHDKLEHRVEERTTELMQTNRQMAKEIVKRSRAEEELHRANRALKTLSECNQAVVRAREEPHLLHEICRIIVDIGGYRLAWVGFAEQDEAKTVQPVAQTGYEEGYLDTVNITWADTERGRGPTGTAIRTSKPNIIKDILTDPNFTPWRAEARNRGYESAMALPLINDGQAFGALNIYAEKPDAFDAEEVKLLMELADDLAYGIMALRTLSVHKQAEEELSKYRKHLEEMVEKRTNELKEKTAKIEESRKALTYLVEDVNQAGEELRKANMEYAAANKELKEFAYIVSHDLKAPLRAISQLTHWISKDYSEAFDADGKEQMDLIIKRVKRMDGLINGILRYSRVGRIRDKKERLDLNLLVNEVIDNIAPPDNVKIIIENELPNVLRDSVRMEQVFQNLIGNAIKFMDKGEGIIKVGCGDEGAYWEFSVSDNGPGIDKGYHDKIFQIFQILTPRDEHESTGIGLTLVKKIIGLYGGSVRVESEVGKGSTFVFTLPKQ